MTETRYHIECDACGRDDIIHNFNGVPVPKTCNRLLTRIKGKFVRREDIEVSKTTCKLIGTGIKLFYSYCPNQLQVTRE